MFKVIEWMLIGFLLFIPAQAAGRRDQQDNSNQARDRERANVEPNKKFHGHDVIHLHSLG
jgi:hypothetical protein